MTMGYTQQQMLDAAKVQPRHRTVAQQAMVNAGQSIQAVRNTDHAAQAAQRAGR